MDPAKPVRALIDRGLALKASPVQLAAVFAFTVIARNLLEAASAGVLFESPAFILHFPVAYVFPMLGLVALMHLFSGFALRNLMKLMVFAWTLTLLPPIIDLVLGIEGDIGYFPLQRHNAGWFLLNFFNPAVTLPGTTMGIRVEAMLGCLLAGVFTWSVAPRRRVLRGVVTTLVFMPVFLTFFTWPYLVHIGGEAFFPGNETTQGMLQWRAFTEVPIHGAAHFTIFIIDMIPVTFLAAWFLSKMSPGQWNRLRERLSDLLPPAVAGVAGTVAVFGSAHPGVLTLADAAAVSGGLLAILWLLASSALTRAYRATALATAFLIGWASGWNTIVFLALSAAVLAMPGPGTLILAGASAAVFFTAVSTGGFPLITPGLLITGALALATGALAGRRWKWLIPGAPLLYMALTGPLDGMGRGGVQGLRRQTDSFFRSGMVSHGHASASKLAASGAGFRALAEGAQLSGMNHRALWAYRVGTALGDSSTEMLKVGINLAALSGDSLRLWNRVLSYIEATDGEGLYAAEVLLSFAASRGDTAFLAAAHGRGGLNHRLLGMYSRAHMALGDSTTALSYALASVSSPAAGYSEWSWALSLSGRTGGNTDSLYRLSLDRLGFNLETALARLSADISQNPVPEQRALLERCLMLNPASPGVLETGASWHLAAGDPEAALHLALRAIAAQMVPSESSIMLAIRAAESAGRPEIAAACDVYARSLYR